MWSIGIIRLARYWIIRGFWISQISRAMSSILICAILVCLWSGKRRSILWRPTPTCSATHCERSFRVRVVIVRSLNLPESEKSPFLYCSRQRHRVQNIEMHQHERKVQRYGPGKSEEEIRFPWAVFLLCGWSARSHLPQHTGHINNWSPWPAAIKFTEITSTWPRAVA